jgi:type II secretory pathway predicted ATPase ExeA
MYERFYNLHERPFNLSPDPDYVYPSRVHTEALGHLRYGIEGRAGFVVITGDIGSGKTTLLQTTLRGIDRRTSVARLVSTRLDDRELIEAVMLDFGLEPPPGRSKPYLLRDLARFLVDLRRIRPARAARRRRSAEPVGGLPSRKSGCCRISKPRNRS